jgi:hypothetical protein
MPFRFFSIIALCLFIHPLFGQQVSGKGKLTGILVTSGNDEPMPFATISIYTPKDSLVEGSLSEENGKFNYLSEVIMPLLNSWVMVIIKVTCFSFQKII